MGRPFRRYCFSLAERLGYGHPRIMYMYLTVQDIVEWMAFDRTQDPEYIKAYNEKIQIEKSAELDAEERSRMIKQLFGR